jgi:uncharacterized protein YqgC (DUF456 family)
MDAPKSSIYKKIGGILFIIIGFIALVTPFTPGSWLIFVGMSLLGIQTTWGDRIKGWFLKK